MMLPLNGRMDLLPVETEREREKKLGASNFSNPVFTLELLINFEKLTLCRQRKEMEAPDWKEG